VKQIIKFSLDFLIFIIIFIFTNFSFSGCVNNKGEIVGLPLKFESIEQEKISNRGGFFEGISPTLIIIKEYPLANNLSKVFNDEGDYALANINYSRDMAIVVFQGWKGSIEYGITIQKIIFIDNSVQIYANVVEPTPGKEEHPMEISPYHLVKLDKTLLSGKEITFELIINQNVEFTTTQIID